MAEHIFLTGYRAVGKTSVAKILGRRCDLPVHDLDQMIVEKHGKTIADIFAEGGEALFRVIESEILAIAIAGDRAVISLGGGAIIRESNRVRIRSAGRCVWLTATAETIAERIANDAGSGANRPSLTDQSAIDEIRSLLERRGPWYSEVADWTVDTESKSAETIADEIETRLAAISS